MTKREQLEEFLYSGSPSAVATNALIVLLAIGGVVIIAGIAPAIFAVSKQFGGTRKYSAKQMNGAYYNLKRGGYVCTVKQRGDKKKMILTNKGKEKLQNLMIEQIKIKKPKKWDGVWRIVMFDIPVKFSKARNTLRFHLKRLGFHQLQKSVWVLPYKCEEEVKGIVKFFGVERYVIFLESKNISDNRILVKHFDI